MARVRLVVGFVALVLIDSSKICSAFGLVKPLIVFHGQKYKPFIQLFAKKPGGGGDGGGGPKDWYSDTPPFVVVRYFAEDGVVDDEIKKILQANFITTLDELDAKSKYIIFLLEEDSLSKYFDALKAARERPRKTVEEVLGGEAVYDIYCISPESVDKYAQEAVAVDNVKILPLNETVRNKPFNLVLGPSGSGKTLFALKRLPTLVYGGDGKYFFTVHFQVEDAFEVMSETGVTLPEAVASVVQSMIEKKLSDEGFRGVKAVKLHLHVILDECGDVQYKKYFDEASKVREIVAGIKAKISYEFTQGVHLTLVGTGLDEITTTIKSVEDANKFRMQPWSLDNFKEFVAGSGHPQQAKVMEVVRAFPILEDLVTNGRCAFNLLNAMATVSFLQKSRLKKFVSVLVSAVADRYIESNALQSLKSAEGKWQVARAVFRELDKATRQPGVPFFADFCDLSQSGRSVATSILDVHVESKGNHLVLVNDKRYALSISPALVLVMVNFLLTDADIAWDWQGFETTAMLSELKRMVVKSQHIPEHLDRLVLAWQLPVPATDTYFEAPMVDNCTVVLNGPGAAYADVIAPYRLVQAKFSSDDSQVQVIDIQTELDMMGLTFSSDHVMQQHLTGAFYTMWKLSPPIPQSVKKTTSHVVNKKYRFECYPMNTLNSRKMLVESAFVVGILEEKWPDNEPHENKTLQHETSLKVNGGGIGASDLLREYDKSHPVTAVFATNCKAFWLTCGAMNIDPNDVDWEGKLKSKSLPNGLSVRKNVEIRFLFY